MFTYSAISTSKCVLHLFIDFIKNIERKKNIFLFVQLKFMALVFYSPCVIRFIFMLARMSGGGDGELRMIMVNAAPVLAKGHSSQAGSGSYSLAGHGEAWSGHKCSYQIEFEKKNSNA